MCRSYMPSNFLSDQSALCLLTCTPTESPRKQGELISNLLMLIFSLKFLSMSCHVYVQRAMCTFQVERTEYLI